MGLGMDSSNTVKTKTLKRQSMPPVARQPLACVSNKVVLKTPGMCSTVRPPSMLPSGLADYAETLPNRKRKLAAGTASARTISSDDDDFA